MSKIEMLRNQVIARIDLGRNLSDEELLEVIDDVILKSPESRYLSISEKSAARKEIFDSIRGFDVLQELIDDPDITEIMVNGPEHIFIEKGGMICPCKGIALTEEKLQDIIQQMVSKMNRRVNEASPIVDTRLPDGSRVNIALNPVAINGPIITIRKFPRERFTMDALIQIGAVTEEAAEELRQLVEAGYNIFISGGTGSGKTTFLNALSDYIPKTERIITIEDSAELQITGVENLVRMEARQENAEGEKAITIRDLIRASLRMRPDRIVVGEVRGAEALDMLQAMNTGHDGSLSTGHANSPKDMLSRLETMVLMGMDMPISAIRGQIASGIDIIIHLERLRDRSRKVVEITEITGYLEGEIQCSTLYRYEYSINQLKRLDTQMQNRKKMQYYMQEKGG